MIISLGSAFTLRVSLLILHVLLLLGTRCSAKRNHLCAASSCGDIRNISFPFRLEGDPKGCGLFRYELSCENNRTVLYLHAGRYYVMSIHNQLYNDEDNFIGYMRVVDDGLQKGNCSSLPRHSLAPSNFSGHGPYLMKSAPLAFVKCSRPVASRSYVDTRPCTEGASSADTPPQFSQMKVYSYAVHGFDLRVGDIEDSCAITMMASWDCFNGSSRDQYCDRVSMSYEDLHDMMADGFDLLYTAHSKSWSRFWCYLLQLIRLETDACFEYNDIFLIMVDECSSLLYVFATLVAAKFILGAPCVSILLIYKWMKRHQAMDADIEEFLRAHNNFLPIRYSYLDIKKITKKFTHKLGEGGYGSVYKGMLKSGTEVAVKILKKSKSDGQDFINEVATIGRIHHVNVVQLIGFCFENSRQALVYDFMPNGSLDKHIPYKDGDDHLDDKKMYEISLGIARGIGYLHKGCDRQILHFDIKPHNILLDRNFTPKVSNFGLAKLYPIGHNLVSLTAARGTLGYMAPELFYKDIGGVSHKSDVYSFGMLLMEMAGRRRNFNAHAQRSSQIYFPLWVYDQLNKENEVEMEDVMKEERETTRKMIVVALWCIQLRPDDRPSMGKVIDMLEGDADKLQLPPKPLWYRTETPVDDVDDKVELETLSSSSSPALRSSGHQLHHDSEFTGSYCSLLVET